MDNTRSISFEGIDFCGKSTQVRLLIDALHERGIHAHLLREPGGTEISEKVREILLNKSHQAMHPRAEILLYSAARAQLVHEKLLPMLASGEYIIADRFFDSTTAYQGFGRGLDLSFVNQLNHFATSGLVPHKTFLLSISPEEAARRRKSAGRANDRLESEHISFYRQIEQGYRQLAEDYSGRFITIPGAGSVENIAGEIKRQVFKIWNLE